MQTGGQADRQTGRQADRQTGRQADGPRALYIRLVVALFGISAESSRAKKG